MKIIYTRPDGGLSISKVADRAIIERNTGQMSDEAFLRHVMERSVPPDAINAQIVPIDWQLPEDRTFRNAWMNDGHGRVSVDMPKARDIHRDWLRAQRAPLLAALDVEFIRASEAGDQAKIVEITERKNKLRDLPADPRIDAAQTPEELKALMLAQRAV